MTILIQFSSGPLPEDVKREILELGFPDDGYNYLLHLRDIKSNVNGSGFYQNPKAKLHQLPHDIKVCEVFVLISWLVLLFSSDCSENDNAGDFCQAYDASRIEK